MLDLVTLEGRHVRLEPLSLNHVPGLVQAANQARDTFGFTDVPASVPDMRSYVERTLAGRESGSMLPIATIDRRAENREADHVVGSTRFGNVEFWSWPEGNLNQRGESLPDVAEIGWTWLSRDAQRTAINTEAKLLMLTHAFETLRVHKVSLKTDSRNERSRTAIERLGVKFDGVIRAAQIAYDGVIRDSAYYSILDAEWPEVKKNLEGRLRA